MGLQEYNSKRDFKITREPKGTMDRSNKHRFVIQRHEARRLHYDLRLEMDGVLKSWAVPKGPSMNSAEKRFAVMTEDHPVSYLPFKGRIPEKHYGGGTMEIWDKGKFIPVDEDMNELTDRQAAAALKKGELKIFLKGKQIEGGYVLIRLKNGEKNWLLIKHNDEYNVRKPYDAEKHPPISRKDGKKQAAKSKPGKTGVAKKKAVKKRVLPSKRKSA
ncbi:MAG: 3'-phosphoesterase [Chitinophagaceae bacterium]|nr:MAG: 3'-phosphoesterase [Chitinophagaceae bacterium]